MGRPMMPSPMKPIFIDLSWLANSAAGLRDPGTAGPGRLGCSRTPSRRRIEDLLELGDLSISGAHRDVGHPLEDHLHHHRHPVLAASALARLRERRLNLFGLEHAHRLAAEAFDHLDVIDAVAAELGRVDVVEASWTSKSISKPRCDWRIRPR